MNLVKVLPITSRYNVWKIRGGALAAETRLCLYKAQLVHTTHHGYAARREVFLGVRLVRSIKNRTPARWFY
jgi:hypothetical protein